MKNKQLRTNLLNAASQFSAENKEYLRLISATEILEYDNGVLVHFERKDVDFNDDTEIVDER